MHTQQKYTLKCRAVMELSSSRWSKITSNGVQRAVTHVGITQELCFHKSNYFQRSRLLAGDQKTIGLNRLFGDASSADREVEQFHADEGPLSAQHPSVSLWEKSSVRNLEATE